MVCHGVHFVLLFVFIFFRAPACLSKFEVLFCFPPLNRGSFPWLVGLELEVCQTPAIVPGLPIVSQVLHVVLLRAGISHNPILDSRL